ncbi:MAG TPA: hypothetical protein VMS56_14165 [Thermoanaerobaculia bacterium]|nr:hypothetical protein [Thermoanaerobaculia bacterium]
MSRSERVLVVSSDARLARAVGERLVRRGIGCDLAGDAPRAAALCHERSYQVIVLDLPIARLDAADPQTWISSCRPRPVAVALKGAKTPLAPLRGDVVPMTIDRSYDLETVAELVATTARDYAARAGPGGPAVTLAAPV